MENIQLLTVKDLAKITHHRSGEIKLGEKALTVPSDENLWDYITNCEAPFVLFGIPEDIGVKANLGRIGTASAYESTLKSLVNTQHNKFCKGNHLLLFQLNSLFYYILITIIINISNYNTSNT